MFWYICTDISEEPAASIILLINYVHTYIQDDGICVYINTYIYKYNNHPDGGGRRFLRNIMGTYLPPCMVSHRRPQ
jgi:hypothetical protein